MPKVFTESEEARAARAVFSEADKLDSQRMTDELKTPFLYQDKSGEPTKSTKTLIEESKRYWQAEAQ